MVPRPGPAPPDTPPRRIHALGQAVWLRGFRRRLVDSGRLDELVSAAAVSGLTLDFLHLAGAVARGPEYGPPVLELLGAGDGLMEGFVAREAAVAAAALRSLYEESDGREGLVAVEVDPSMAQDAEMMARATRRLLATADAPNVMPVLPATNSGFAVFETLIADGLHAGVGPTFTVGSTLRAAEAFARGARDTGAAGPQAVVTFGVASLDNLVDQLLHREIRGAASDMSRVESLLGGAGVAAAKVAWRRTRELLAGRAPEAGGRLRTAWTDLAPSDPRQPHERYVERLIGPGTIAVLDPSLLTSLMRRGEIEATLGQRVDVADELLAELVELGVDSEEVGSALEAKALRRARLDHARLAQRLEKVAAILADDAAAATARAVAGAPWGARAVEIDGAGAPTGGLAEVDAIGRMWDKDASLWTDDPEEGELVRNRLGWLDAAASTAADSDPMVGFAAELEAGEVESVVLLGMGGSSQTADVCRRVFRNDRLRVLDSTDPGRIRTVAGRVDPARTAVLVASKSGETLEVRALFDWFYALATPMLDRPGERFAAVTDPGTPLEQLALERGFSRLWLAPADVGGRFSALTVFGTLPMALMGIDVPAVLAAGRRMATACAPEVEAAVNPAARLAAALHHAWRQGRDKVTFVAATPFAAFGLWAEQLVAESTGKQGRGLIPIVGEPEAEPDDYAEDRVFVSLTLREDETTEHRRRLDALEAAGHPVLRFELEDRHELGAEFFRWQAAIALLGALMRVNPFDEPDVQASKERTAALLAAHAEGTPMSDRPPVATAAEWAVFADIERDEELAAGLERDDLAGWLAAHLGRAKPPDYVAVQAFLAGDEDSATALQGVRRLLLERRGVASTLGWGPAFLHSTGQLHKGGPDSGLFLQITADDEDDIEVPGAGYSFGQLLRAQSLGDLAALQERGRRVLRVHLRDPVAGCRLLLEAAEAALD